jgi:4-hydroxythreonine-4-phosphate dehydrogenase
MHNTCPPLLFSMGDPAGIGPEIILSATARHPERLPDVLVVGDWAVMQAARERLVSQTDLFLPVLQEWVGEGGWDGGENGVLRVVQAGSPATDLPPMGRISAGAGQLAADAIAAAARRVLSGWGRGMITAPIHKEALAAAGIDHPGHTEYLQALAADHLECRIDQVPVRMMLSCPGLRTVLVSIHVALQKAIDLVTTDRVLETIRITDRCLRVRGGERPRIGVAGLNPHAGEGGLFGTEELRVIAPAVEAARAEGIDVSGPHPPDTVFMRARQGAFDVVVAMYHDQGLIPVKLLGLEHGVNTTLGLPFVRTSPDHGTAFDLAGTGRADPSSLVAAWDAALDMTAPP